jgi:outer membrane protein OmpA-like peptidoglycan-associated protein
MSKRKRLLLFLLSGWLIFCVVWFFRIYQKDEKKSTKETPVNESPQVLAITSAPADAAGSMDIAAMPADSALKTSTGKTISDSLAYASNGKADTAVIGKSESNTSQTADEIEKNKTVLPAAVNSENKKLSVCYFYHNSDKKIKNFSYRLTKEIQQYTASPDAKITITGHTDYIGSAEYNYNLGLQRAERVKQLLIKKGIAAERIVVLSKGEEQPVSGNRSIGGRAKNRRVEINITFS